MMMFEWMGSSARRACRCVPVCKVRIYTDAAACSGDGGSEMIAFEEVAMLILLGEFVNI